MRAVFKSELKHCIRLSKLSSCIAHGAILIFGIVVLLTQTVNALESCYLASDSTDRLVLVVDRSDGSTSVDVGPFGASLIEALAKEPFTGVVYAANANQLGTVNLDTGAFTPTASTFGTAFAANGDLTADVSLNDVDALAFDLSTGFLYGVQNTGGNEVLFRINPNTGALVPGVFGGNDYLLISGTGSVDDIAIDQLGTMFASDAGNLYTVNFAATGTTAASFIGSFGGPNDMEGLSTDVPGNLIGTTGANNSISAFNNSIWDINKTTGAASNQVSIPIGGDYEGVTCALATVDLSLSKTVTLTNDADSSGNVTPGDEITYSILVTNNDVNQLASAVEVTDNLNTLTGLTFLSSNSTKASPPNPYNSTTGVWSLGLIPANTSYQLNVIYNVDAAAAGNTIVNTAEVTRSANPDPDSEPDNDDGDQSEDDEDNASITVNFAAPTIFKNFGTDPIAIGGISTLIITLGNTNATVATLTADLVDTLPTAGNGDVVVAAVPNIGGTCNSANVTAVAGTSTITFANGATIPATTGCTIIVDVTSSIAGAYTNTIPAGALQTDLGNNTAAASDNLTVSANPPPTVTKLFSPNTINAGGTSQLTITLGNANASAITLIASMDDNLPTGVTVTLINAATTCPGSVDISVNTRVRYPTGATIPSGGCNIVVDVTSNTLGVVTNTILTGALQTDVGSNASSASDNLTVNAGGGTPSCPAGQTLSTPTPNPNYASAQTNVGVTNPNNSLGVYSAASSTASNANSANLRNNDILRLEFADTLAQNSNVILSLARDRNNGRVNIAFSDDGINEDAQVGTFGNGGTLGSGTVDILTHLALTVPGDGYRYLIIRRLNGRNWVDGASYDQICETPPTSDLVITKDDSSATYTPGGTSTYVLTITNNGPDSVTGAAIQDLLPNGVTLSALWSCSATAGSSCSAASGGSVGGSIVFLTANILNGGVITVNVPVQFSANMGDY